jgi:hypothetical protein
MSNQIEDDEIEQLGNEVAILETALCVNSAIVGDLLIGEIDSWHLGICEVKTRDTEDQLIILGQNNHVVGRIDTDVWTNSVLFEDTEVKDLAKIADKTNSAIAAEYSEI